MTPAQVEQLIADALAAPEVLAGASPVAVLRARSTLADDVIVQEIGRRAGLPVLTTATLRVGYSPSFDHIPVSECLGRELLPVYDAAGVLTVVVADPYAPLLRNWLERRLSGRRFHLALATRDAVSGFIAEWGESHRVSEIVEGGAASVQASSLLTITVASLREEHPAVRALNAILLDALNGGASDVHLENSAAGLVVRLRLDGVLVSVNSYAGRELAEQVVSRIKVLSELDISERRIPQDGRFRAIISERDVDVRVSIMPGLFGEDAVLRILDRKHLTESGAGLTLERLGFDDAARATLRRLARQPYGMLLVTGPTGSGKTTSLYAVLSETKTGSEKVITIEDPVEYQLDGVLQIPVNEAKGLTFARGLRSILRHDPDTIMVGEIRDEETAAISIQAALTGHLVFTSVHANNIFDVIQRFRHMGVDAYAMTSAINGIVAQRLMRKVCAACVEAWVPDADFLSEHGFADSVEPGVAFRKGRGCAACHGTGYKGRMAIAEFLALDDELRELIVSQAPMSKVKAAARERGTRFLREVALDAARDGLTTLHEVSRVTFAD